MNREISRSRDYWDREVRALDSVYSREKSRLGAFLDSVFRWDMHARFGYTLEHAEPIENRTFLDVGCGTGRYTLALARKGATRAVGIDISATMIAFCRQLAADEKLDGVCSFTQTDLLEYDPDGGFDICIGIGLFDYISDPLPVLAKLRTCTTDKAILSFPRLWTWRAPVRKIRLGLRRCDVHFYTKARVDRLLNESGFARYDVSRIGQLYCVTAFAR